MDALTLLVPGLGGSVGTAPINTQFPLVLDELARERVFDAWAVMCAAGHLEQTLVCGAIPAALGCAWLGIAPDDASGDWPLAGLSWFADQPPLPLASTPGGFGNSAHMAHPAMHSKGCICIEPVHLEATHNGLMASDPRELALAEDEAEALSLIIAPLCNADGITLHTPSAQRWYLTTPSAVRLQTVPLASAVGLVDAALPPQGEDAAQWMRWLNEVQLSWHDCVVNQRRSDRGQATVNSVWLSATGCPSAVPSRAPLPDVVSTDEPAITGLAAWCNISHRALVDGYTALERTTPPQQRRALVLECGLYHPARTGDWSAWRDKLNQFATDWLQPLWLALRERKLQSLEIMDECGRRLQLRSGARRRWWRSRSPIGWWRIGT